MQSSTFSFIKWTHVCELVLPEALSLSAAQPGRPVSSTCQGREVGAGMWGPETILRAGGFTRTQPLPTLLLLLPHLRAELKGQHTGPCLGRGGGDMGEGTRQARDSGMGHGLGEQGGTEALDRGRKRGDAYDHLCSDHFLGAADEGTVQVLVWRSVVNQEVTASPVSASALSPYPSCSHLTDPWRDPQVTEPPRLTQVDSAPRSARAHCHTWLKGTCDLSLRCS